METKGKEQQQMKNKNDDVRNFANKLNDRRGSKLCEVDEKKIFGRNTNGRNQKKKKNTTEVKKK